MTTPTIRKQKREWARKKRGNISGVLFRKYRPHQWSRCSRLIDKGVSIKGAAMLSDLSYQIAWRIATGRFSYGVKPRKDED